MTDAGSNRVVLVMTTVPGDEEGRRIARLLVESRLAACVQILPPMISIYRWESRLEEAAEQLLLIKTLHRLYPEVERTILEAHPYQTPEVVALPIEAVASGYLDWLTAAVIPPDKLATIAD